MIVDLGRIEGTAVWITHLMVDHGHMIMVLQKDHISTHIAGIYFIDQTVKVHCKQLYF